jgi:hypothetical protein
MSFNQKLILFAFALMAVMSWLFLCSCYTQHRATRQITHAQATYPTMVAELAALWYPVRRDTFERKMYLPGKEIQTPGPVQYVNCDSLTRANNGKAPVKVAVPCPPSSRRVDTVYRDRIVYQENTAALEAEKGKRKQADDQHIKDVAKISSQKKALNIAIWAAIILGVYTLGRWVLRIWGIRLP